MTTPAAPSEDAHETSEASTPITLQQSCVSKVSQDCWGTRTYTAKAGPLPGKSAMVPLSGLSPEEIEFFTGSGVCPSCFLYLFSDLEGDYAEKG